MSRTITQKQIETMIEETPKELTTSYMAVPETEEVTTYGKDITLLSPLEREVALSVASGQSFSAIATIVDLDSKTVKLIRNRPHVRKFITEYVSEVTVKAKANREDLVAQIIEARLNNLQEGEDLSNITKKDTLDLILALDTMQKEREKQELGTKESAVVNILNLIKKD